MPSLLDIRRRVRAVKSTQQITKAMKMVAASKLRRAQDRVQHARPYAQQMLRVLNSLATRVAPSAHPLLDERTVPEAGGMILVWNEFKSVLQQRVVVEQLLPRPGQASRAAPGKRAAIVEYRYEPAPE